MTSQNSSAVAITGGTIAGASYTSQLKTIDGVVTAPAYSFTSDTDSGIYSYLPNAIGFATGGADTVTIFSNTFYLWSGVQLQLGNQYVAGAPTPTGYLLIKDQSGNTYRIPAVLH